MELEESSSSLEKLDQENYWPLGLVSLSQWSGSGSDILPDSFVDLTQQNPASHLSWGMQGGT